MWIAIRLCAGLAVVCFGLSTAILATAPPGQDCRYGICSNFLVVLVGAAFGLIGTWFAVPTGVLVLVAGLETRQKVLGVGLALLIVTNLVALIVVNFNLEFDQVLFFAPSGYFAYEIPWYFNAAGTTLYIMLALAPLPALLFTSSLPRPRAGSSTPPSAPGRRPQILPWLALTCVLLSGTSVVVVDRVVDHYAVVGMGPGWPLLAAAGGFYAFWLVAWLLLMMSVLCGLLVSVSGRSQEPPVDQVVWPKVPPLRQRH